MVWVCLGEPLSDLPEFAYGDDPAFRLILAGPYFFRAKGPRVIENLFDVAHLGFVHAGLLGDPQHGEIEDYEVGKMCIRDRCGPSVAPGRSKPPANRRQ